MEIEGGQNGKQLLMKNEIIFSGKIRWIREDSLANIAAIEIVDLPLSDSEGSIEDQMKNSNGKSLMNSTKHLNRS